MIARVGRRGPGAADPTLTVMNVVIPNGHGVHISSGWAPNYDGPCNNLCLNPHRGGAVVHRGGRVYVADGATRGQYANCEE
jgi:hypothetical protein